MAAPEDFRPFRLEIVQNGEVIRSIEQTEPSQTELSLDFEIDSSDGFWIAARVSEKPGIEFRNRTEAHTTPIYVVREGLRFWKHVEVEKLITDRLADLDEVEELIQLAEQSKREDKNLRKSPYTNWGEWAREYRVAPIIAQQEKLRPRMQKAMEIYDNLRSIHAAEKAIRSAKSK